jgi:homoserine O-succinyltransferase
MSILAPILPSRGRSPRHDDHDPIVVGLVNNMPDAALQSTERQFREVLSATSHNRAVCLRLFSMPELPRADSVRSHLGRYYEDISELWVGHLDGLIVTGTPPRAACLMDESYWSTLTKIVDWAEDNSKSTIWSCLAAHAAVLYLDGIERQRLDTKLSGIFDCIKATDHPVLLGAPSRWRIPHSRNNELAEAALVSNGYHILSRSPDAGVDMFAKQRGSLFFFMQGHPEYDPGALLREYRRDVSAFLTGERDSYPEMPCGYFGPDTAAGFAAFRQRALRERDIDLLASFPTAGAGGELAHGWQGVAVRIYANWLSYLIEQRHRSLGPVKPLARPRMAI